jgi:hypothetical protein
VGNTGRTWMPETSAARAQTAAIAGMVSPASSPQRESWTSVGVPVLAPRHRHVRDPSNGESVCPAQPP